MKVLIMNLGAYFDWPTPGGGMRYVHQHMTRMNEQGHKCIYFTMLVEESSLRADSLSRFKAKGYKILTEEMPTIFIDKIIGGKYDVVAITYKSKSEINYNELFVSRTKKDGNENKMTSVFKYRKSYFQTLISALKYGKVIWSMRQIVSQRKELEEQEIYFQDIVSYFKSNSEYLIPELFIVEGPLEYNSLALDMIEENKKIKLISLIQAPYIFPFGSKAMFSEKTSIFNEEKVKEIYKRYDGFITPSNFTKQHLLESSGLDLKVYAIHPLVEIDDNHLNFKPSYSKEKNVTLINASNFKGLSIFIELAKALPKVNFLAVTTRSNIWAKQLKEMNDLPNIEMMKAIDPVDPIYDKTSILLMPSLWDEPFGMVVVEAMLRGIPVIGSNHGGIPEAKLGVDFLIKINPYKNFTDTFPPKQDINPWIETIERLLYSEELYKEVADKSQIASREFIEKNKSSSIVDCVFNGEN